MKYELDGGDVIIQDGDKKIVLDWTEFDEMLNVILGGMCWICSEKINDGAHLCCQCVNDEVRWHIKHCETTGAHNFSPSA